MDPARNLETRISAVEQLLAAQAAQVPLPASPPRVTAPPIAMPERYDGDPDQCRGFLMQVGFYVEEHPEMFSNPGAEVRFTVSLLTGRAREWTTVSPLSHSHQSLNSLYPSVMRGSMYKQPEPDRRFQ
uniref:DUF4939 domain-containing protein n=1 Tax=Paramormyrops kingsleyae TaxID=1676925 RepID=A0A3B3RD20_9TELE